MMILIFSWWLLKKFKKSNYGLCRGWEFYSWMRQILEDNNAETAEEFNSKTVKSAKDFGLKYMSETPNIPASKISIISCDITFETKMEFPKDLHRYRYAKTVTASDLVRASMSIPLFFKPHVIRWTNNYSKMIKNKPDRINHFVDGGLLSNFPINVFHDPSSKTCLLIHI